MENYTKGKMGNYTVNIDSKVYQKIMHWIDKASGEVSGLGRLTIDKQTNAIRITHAYLLDQKNTSTSTDIDALAIGKLAYTTQSDGGHFNFWWHSHVNMDVFWSGTDLDTIRQIGSGGFVLATVFNKKREKLSCLYKKEDDLFPETFIDDIQTNIVDYIPREKIELWDKEFDDKCKPAYVAPLTSWEPKTYAIPSAYNSNRMNDELNDWYDSFNKQAQNNFSFSEKETIETNDDAKIFAVEPQLEILCEEMRTAQNYGRGKYFINQIFSRINKLKLSDEDKCKEFKKYYLDEFNFYHPTVSGGAK
jgi:hypothetical protein